MQIKFTIFLEHVGRNERSLVRGEFIGYVVVDLICFPKKDGEEELVVLLLLLFFIRSATQPFV